MKLSDVKTTNGKTPPREDQPITKRPEEHFARGPAQRCKCSNGTSVANSSFRPPVTQNSKRPIFLR